MGARWRCSGHDKMAGRLRRIEIVCYAVLVTVVYSVFPKAEEGKRKMSKIISCVSCGVSFDADAAREEKLFVTPEGKPACKRHARYCQVSSVCPVCASRGSNRRTFAVNRAGVVGSGEVVPEYLAVPKKSVDLRGGTVVTEPKASKPKTKTQKRRRRS